MLYIFCLSFLLSPSTFHTFNISFTLTYADLLVLIWHKSPPTFTVEGKQVQILLTIVTNACINHAESHTLALTYFHICPAKM